MTDSLVPPLIGYWVGGRIGSAARLLWRRLWLAMTSTAQDVRAHIPDILGTMGGSGSMSWQRVVPFLGATSLPMNRMGRSVGWSGGPTARQTRPKGSTANISVPGGRLGGTAGTNTTSGTWF